MFKEVTYKTKNRALMLGVVLFLLAAYNLGLKKTIALYNDCSTLNAQLETANIAPQKMAEFQKKITQLDKLIGTQSGSNEMQQSIIGVVTNYCKENNTILEEYPKPCIMNDKGMSIETTMFSVEGSFNKLLDLAYAFEQKIKMGKVVSVQYKAKRDGGTHKVILTMTIYLQNIKKNNHEA